MAKLRIGVLYDYWWDEDETRTRGGTSEEEVPRGGRPGGLRGAEEGRPQSGLRAPRRHAREPARAGAARETDLVFNLVESFGGDDSHDTNVAGYLELLGRRFTGAGSSGLYLAQDKALAEFASALSWARWRPFEPAPVNLRPSSSRYAAMLLS